MKTLMTTLAMTGLLGSALMAQTTAPAGTTAPTAKARTKHKHQHKANKPVAPATTAAPVAPATK
jgi:hypothetical protein